MLNGNVLKKENYSVSMVFYIKNKKANFTLGLYGIYET
jgi:hypothetical protein